MRVLWLALLLTACGDDDSDDTNETDTDTDVDSDTDTDTDTDSDTEPDPTKADLHGTVTFDDGSPVVNARVNVCRSTCITVRTDASGAYDFNPLTAQWGAYYVIPNETDVVRPNFAILLGEGDDQNVNIVVREPVWKTLPTTATEVELVSGLYVTVGKDTLLPPDAFSEPATQVGAVLVPASEMPDPQIEGFTPIAMWYLAPFEYKADGGMPTRIHNDFGLAPDTVVQVYLGPSAAELQGDWLDEGTLVVSSDGQWLEGALAIEHLTSLVIGTTGG